MSKQNKTESIDGIKKSISETTRAIAGNENGEAGREWIERQNGSIDRHNGNDENELYPGDVFVMQTPSGGGFGAKN